MDPLLQEVVDALAAFSASPSPSRAAVIQTAAASYENMIAPLPADLAAQVAQALSSRGVAVMRPAMISQAGLRLGTITIPWIGVALVAGLLYFAKRRT